MKTCTSKTAIARLEENLSDIPLVPGGLPQESNQPGIYPTTFEEASKQRHAATIRTLALGLLIILGGAVLLHYGCVMYLVYRNMNEGAKILEDAFHAWLPVLAGLAGSAVTYYFTRNGKRD